MSVLAATGSARFGVPGHPEEVDEPFSDTFRGLTPPLPPPPPLTNCVKGRFGVAGGGRAGEAGAAAGGVPFTVPGP